MFLSIDHVRERLAQHSPVTHSRITAPKRASVAVLLRYPGCSEDLTSRRHGDLVKAQHETLTVPEVLLMVRAERKGDRWSGQVALPGGREEPHDATLLETAIRETREEVGLDLHADAEYLGAIDSIRAVARGKLLPMTIRPYIFLERRAGKLTLNEEAADTFWLPLRRAASGELDRPYEYRKGPLHMTLPSWKIDSRVVWGLTYQMLESLLTLLRRGL